MSIVNTAYRWWRENDGVLTNAKDVYSSAVIFAPKVDNGSALAPLLVGKDSLPALVLGSTDFGSLATSLRYQSGYADEVAEGYRHALDRRQPIEDIHHCAGLTTAGQIDMKIRKIALPVRTTEGGLLIMAYSERVSIH